MATVELPSVFRQFTRPKRSSLSVAGATVGEVIVALERQCPGITARVLTASGTLQRYVNVFVDGEEVRSLAGLDTKVNEGSVISLLLAVAGG